MVDRLIAHGCTVEESPEAVSCNGDDEGEKEDDDGVKNSQEDKEERLSKILVTSTPGKCSYCYPFGDVHVFTYNIIARSYFPFRGAIPYLHKPGS